MIRCALLTGVALWGAAACANAADLSVARNGSYYPGAYAPGSIGWQGFYAGLQFGGAIGGVSWTDPFSGLSDSTSGASPFAGGQIGVNYQWDWLVIGGEADWDWMSLRGSSGAGGFEHRETTQWLSTFTVRGGYALDRLLFYVKGGIALTDERNISISPTGITAVSSNDMQVGWTLGTGLEYAFTHNWSARVEYDFADFPGSTRMAGPVLTKTTDSDLSIHKFVAAFNYRF